MFFCVCVWLCFVYADSCLGFLIVLLFILFVVSRASCVLVFVLIGLVNVLSLLFFRLCLCGVACVVCSMYCVVFLGMGCL